MVEDPLAALPVVLPAVAVAVVPKLWDPEPFKVLAVLPAAAVVVAPTMTEEAVLTDVTYGACVVSKKVLGVGGVKFAGAGGNEAFPSKVHPAPVGGQAKRVVAGVYALALVPAGVAFSH